MAAHALVRGEAQAPSSALSRSASSSGAAPRALLYTRTYLGPSRSGDSPTTLRGEPHRHSRPVFASGAASLVVPAPDCLGGSPLRFGGGSALVFARRVDRASVSKTEEISPGIMPRGASATLKAHRKPLVIAWFLGNIQATEALISSVLDITGPTTSANRPHQHTGPVGLTPPIGPTLPANRPHRHTDPPKQPTPQERPVETYG